MARRVDGGDGGRRLRGLPRGVRRRLPAAARRLLRPAALRGAAPHQAGILLVP